MGFPAFYCCVILPRPLLVLVHLLDLLRHTFSSPFLTSPPSSSTTTSSSSSSSSSSFPSSDHGTPSTIKCRLPTLPFSSHLRLRHHNHDPLCTICLCPLEPSHPVRLLPHCSHPFHQGCLDTWLDQGHLTCPLCRSRLLLEPNPPLGYVVDSRY